MKHLLFLMCAALAMASASCDNAKVNIDQGEGQIDYDGKSYSINIANFITVGPDSTTGTYKHTLSFLSTQGSTEGSFFMLYLRNSQSASAVTPGTYTVAASGNITASYTLQKSDGTLISRGDPVGTMIVSANEASYHFKFTGSDGGENSKDFKFEYKDKPSSE